MERRKFVERTARLLPVLAVLGIALSACGNDKNTIPEQLQETVQDGGELCAERAETNADAAFPPVSIAENPTAKELEVALDAQIAIEQQKPEFQAQEYEECIDENLVGPFENEINAITSTTTEG